MNDGIEHDTMDSAMVVPEDEKTESPASRSVAAWQETDEQKWGGEPPSINMVVDPFQGFVLKIRIAWNAQRQKQSGKELMEQLLGDLVARGVITGSSATVEEEDPKGGEDESNKD